VTSLPARGHDVTRPMPWSNVGAVVLARVLGAAGCLLTAIIALENRSMGDYITHGPPSGNNAGPVIYALAHGDLARAVSVQPTMGLASVVLRAPLAALTWAFGGGDLLAYQLGTVICLLPLGLLAAWIIEDRRTVPGGWLAGVGAAFVLLISPAMRDAIGLGHPEDVLAAVLATGSVLAAVRGRTTWAAAMLGVAVGTMPWAVIAVAPVLIAVPGQRLRVAAIAAGIAAVLTLSFPLADPAAFWRAIHNEGATHLANMFSPWWSLSAPVHIAAGLRSTARLLPAGLSRMSATLVTVAVIVVGLALVWARARRGGGRCDPLALLALLGLVRAVADTTQLEYYYVAFLIPMVTWEAVALNRWPLIGVIATGKLALMPDAALDAHTADVNIASIGPKLVLLVYLAHRAFCAKGVRTRATSSAVAGVARAQIRTVPASAGRSSEVDAVVPIGHADSYQR
jgi:hypothetical protein